MKRHLIILNIAFFIFGNVLFSSIHLHEHSSHLFEEVNECLECIYSNNNNDNFLEYNNIYIIEFHVNYFDLDKIILIDSFTSRNNLSRAPPIS